MKLRRAGFLRLMLSLLCPVSFTQQAPPQPAEQKPAAATSSAVFEPDYSKEPFVIESMHYHVRFDVDGTGRQEATVRIRVISQAGVQQLGQLVLSYNAANQKMEIGYVRVRKADGSVVTAGVDAVQDLSAPISTEAPMYTDLRQKHVSVPALQPGETFEYSVTTVTDTALAPGNFWFEYNFEKNVITLDEQLEVDVPRTRSLTIKTQPGFEPKTSEENGRRFYRWNRSYRLREEEEKANKKKPSRLPQTTDVQLTTFENWEQVGSWYRSLERDRATPTPELRAKAAELTRGLATPLGKIEALYDFVSKNFRYVSLSFGLGRFQPHAAAEVLANQYGDCKDKHTLLSALAQAVGMDAYPVLIPSQRKLDRDVPSPAQFDHVISVVPLGGDMVWLDTTAEVAPFRLLATSLRSKTSLVIPREAPAHLVETPPNPPFASTQEVEIEAALSDLGKLDARVRYTLRGDSELVLRSAFRRTPQKQWKALAQLVANGDGFRGEVKEVTASDPAATREPFHLEYRLEMPGYLDWSNKRVQLVPPLPGMGLPDADEDADESSEPVELGSPFSVTARMKLLIPARYSARMPVAVKVARDYAEYRSHYSVEGSTLAAERTLRLVASELPAERAKDYALFFRRAVRNDEAQNFSLESSLAAAPEIPADAKAEELLQAASAAAQNSNFSVAASLLEKLVANEPKHKQAWKLLGFVRMAMQQYDPAIEAFRKQAEVNPYDENAFYGMGLAFYQQQKYEDSAAALRKQLEVKPLDKTAQGTLGIVLREWRKYSEAAPELERAVALSPDDANLYVNLGQTYLNLDQSEKAATAFDKAVELDTSPTTLNNVAYELTVHSVNLDRAQRYAESAVATTAGELQNAALERLQLQDLQRTTALASYWDTVGWIHYRRGDLAGAEKFVEAAWLLNYRGEVGDHLGQIYEKMGKKQDALRLYALATAATHLVPESRAHLSSLAGSNGGADALVKNAAADLSALKTLSLGKLLEGKEEAGAEFYVLLGPGPRVESVRFVRGNERLRSLGERLRGLSFGRVFPDETPTRIIRRGTLSCAGDGACVFVLQSAESITSVN